MRIPLFALVLLAILTLPIEAGDRKPLSERKVRDLIDALDHPNPAVRVEAADELGRRRDGTSLIPLIRTLRDALPEVRAHAAEALRALGDERAVPFLSRSLSDPFDLVRCRAVLALGDLAGKYVVPTVTRCLGDPSAVVRAGAIRALGEIGEPLSLDAVLSAAKREGDDRDFAVRAAAIVAAAKIGGTGGLDGALEILGEDLALSWLLRASAAHAAGIVGDADRLPRLVESLETDDDPRVCQAAAGAMARLGGCAELVAALDLSDARRRQAAVVGLGGLESVEARSGLVRAVRDESRGVVLAAATALAARGEREAIPVLVGLLEGEAQVWLGALEVLELRTGRTFGRNPARWRTWYSDVHERLKFDAEAGIYREGRR